MHTPFVRLQALLCLLPLICAEARPARKGQTSDQVEAGTTGKPASQRSLPSSTWHLWSDTEGRSVYAELLSKDGDHVSVRTEDHQTYRLNLNKLAEVDREFALKAERMLPGRSIPVAQAAAQVDALVDAGLNAAGLQRNQSLPEAQFVRRLYLDAAGRIPTAAELTAYLQDKSPDKRSRLIDSLLASDGYNSQFFDWLADMLRLKDDFGKGIKSYVYQEWVKDQIAANRHWDTLVYELMTAEGRITSSGPVGYLLRDRGMPLDNLSNTLTTFLGANVACAQCHDHPLASWTERNFYEMAAFFGATEQGYTKGSAKQLLPKGQFDKAVFNQIIAPNMAKVESLPSNKLRFPKDYKYDDAKPGDPVLPKLIQWSSEDAHNPSYAGTGTGDPSKWRDQFAVWLTHPENPRFATAIANRLWKKTFGLGVQEPVTDLDDPKEASNPALLAHLSSEMKRVHFDLREFQRILFHTQAYQSQASPAPSADSGPYLFPGPLLRRMSADQVWDSVLTLAVGPKVDHFKLRRAGEMRKLDLPIGQLNSEQLASRIAEIKGSGTRLKGKGAGKKGKGAEVSLEEFEGEPPPTFEGLTLARASELTQPSKESHFLRNFGQSDRDIADTNSTEGGVPQVLLMMNGEVQKAVSHPSSMVMKEASEKATPAEQVRFLYLSFLGRPPSPGESSTTLAMLSSELKLKDLTWVLLNTREFLFIQ